MGNLLKYIFFNIYIYFLYTLMRLEQLERNTGTKVKKTTSLNVINLSAKLPDCSFLLALVLQNNGVEQLYWK